MSDMEFKDMIEKEIKKLMGVTSHVTPKRKWKSFTIKDKKYQKKENKNSILYPEGNKSIEEISEVMTILFEEDRTKSME